MNGRRSVGWGVALVASLWGLSACGQNACEELACRFSECAGGSSCDVENATFPDDCTCAECFLDTGKDVCTELLEIAAECESSCR